MSEPTATQGSRGRLWSGRAMSGLPALFLLLDAAMKLEKPPFVVRATEELGYPEGVIRTLGVILLGCTVLYLVPRTAVLGAILLTAYLGGAVATQVRVGNPLFTHVLSPVYFCVLLWGGLVLRDELLRQLIPMRRRRTTTLEHQ
jgi:DoxX-like family